jgi:hypothetical protein
MSSPNNPGSLQTSSIEADAGKHPELPAGAQFVSASYPGAVSETARHDRRAAALRKKRSAGGVARVHKLDAELI